MKKICTILFVLICVGFQHDAYAGEKKNEKILLGLRFGDREALEKFQKTLSNATTKGYIISADVKGIICLHRKITEPFTFGYDNITTMYLVKNNNQSVVLANFGYEADDSKEEDCWLVAKKLNQALGKAKGLGQYMTLNLYAQKPEDILTIPTDIYVKVPNEGFFDDTPPYAAR